MTVDEINAMPADVAAETFRACCGSSRWVNGMVSRRPYRSPPELLYSADKEWDATEREDWHEAFSHHPRIGEQKATAVQSAQSAGWSSREQGEIQAAPEAIQRELAEANRAYEARFGHIYIVCAARKSAAELLAIARERLTNDPKTELEVAAKEQRKITRLRLEKLLGDT